MSYIVSESSHFEPHFAPPPVSPKIQSELILTPMQAQQIRMKKGYALEPVIPTLNLESPLGRGLRHKRSGRGSQPALPDSRREQKRISLQRQLQAVNRNLEAIRSFERELQIDCADSVSSAADFPAIAQTVAVQSPSAEIESHNSPHQTSQLEVVYQAPASLPDAPLPQLPQLSSSSESSQQGDFSAPPSPQLPSAHPILPAPTSNSAPKSARKARVAGLDRPAESVDAPRQKRVKRPKVTYEEESLRHEPPFYAGCRQLIKVLRSKKESIQFHEPVNTRMVPDYLSVVQRPMDLSTVSQKLSDRKYAVYEEFAADVRLMFDNCLLYNKRETLYAQNALYLQDVYAAEEEKLKVRGRLSNVAQKVERQGARAHKRSRANPVVEDEMNRLKQQLQLIQSQLQGIHGQQADQTVWDVANAKSKSRNRTKKPRAKRDPNSIQAPVLPAALRFVSSDSESDDEAMTYDEKCALSENINRLPAPKLSRVIDIIHERKPELNRQTNPEIEIDIDSLDNATLRRLERYVNSCVAPTKRSKSKPKPGARVIVNHLVFFVLWI
eukprot:c9688_g1_i3.p1 GENE.c9688_g1_i3~~c9688_g1_i3.p1  ORF type:complete len:554 (+),score=61.84 c9688_g1_i3:108-1769(+)